MSKNILIDTTNNIETRIAVTDDGKLDDFEIEPSKKNAVKGDIYLAKLLELSLLFRPLSLTLALIEMVFCLLLKYTLITSKFQQQMR